MRKASRKTLKKKADKLFSEYIRMDGKCNWCGKKENLQTAHIFSRRFLSTRWSSLNAMCLCAGCHRKAHDQPVEFTEFVKKELGEEVYNELRREAKVRYIKVDLEEVVKKLKRMIEYKDEESRCSECGGRIVHVCGFKEDIVCIKCKEE